MPKIILINEFQDHIREGERETDKLREKKSISQDLTGNITFCPSSDTRTCGMG
jgi:hypothetical protein